MDELAKKHKDALIETWDALGRHLLKCPRLLHIHVLAGGEERAKLFREVLEQAGWKEDPIPHNHILAIVGKDITGKEVERLRGEYEPCGVVVWGARESKMTLCQIVGTTEMPIDAAISAMDILRSEAALIQSLAEERARTSQALTHLEHLIATRDDFFSIATHDLRSPLTTLKLSLSMLNLDDHPEDKEIIIIMGRNISRMEALVNDMLEVFRLYRGTFALNLADTQVNQIVEDNVISFYPNAIEKDITLDFLLDNRTPLIKADPFRVNQVVANLISNALKYTANGGIIEVSTSWDGRGVVVSVKDTGPGIPAKEQGKIFESFSKGSADATGGEQSTGLGLYICKRIMEMHGGRIWVKSQQGKGSTFHVFFPHEPATYRRES